MTLDIRFKELTERLNIQFTEVEEQFHLKFRETTPITHYVGGTPYEGAYDVTPTVEGKQLPTAQKVMLEDLIIKAIPRYDVTNLAGGTTIYIANEV